LYELYILLPDFMYVPGLTTALIELFSIDRFAPLLAFTCTVLMALRINAGTRQVYARKVLIATGARANIPNIEGIEKVKYITNEEALFLDKLPESIIIVGGRALGLEFAQLFARFGVKVTLLQRSSTIIPDHEPEIASLLHQYLSEDGIEIRTGEEPARVREHKGRKIIETKNGSNFEADELLLATGRRPI